MSKRRRLPPMTERVDEMIQTLLRHKRDVWPDAP